MKTVSSNFSHVKGESAYLLFWKKRFNCLIYMSTIESCYLNLELIVYDGKAIVAFRYDTPEDMKWMYSNDGEWQSHDLESIRGVIWLSNVLQIHRDKI
jgi:hypothetical protein